MASFSLFSHGGLGLFVSFGRAELPEYNTLNSVWNSSITATEDDRVLSSFQDDNLLHAYDNEDGRKTIDP